MKWPDKNFWCTTALELNEVADLLRDPFALELSGDCENVWEWREGHDRTGAYWNLSRQWDDDKPNTDFRLQIVIDPVPASPSAHAAHLARLLSVPVSFGTVKYLSGDDFSFDEDFTTPNKEEAEQ